MEVTIAANKPVSIFKKPEPPKTPSNEPPAPPPTADEIAARAREVGIAMGWDKPDPTAVQPAQPAPIQPSAPPPAAPNPPPVVPPAPAVVQADETERIIRRTADETARLIMERTPTPPVAPAALAALAFEMGESDARDLRIIQYMAKTNPKHADLPAKFTEFVKALYAYQDKWAAENPGEEFDIEAPAHAEMLARRPNIDEEEMRDADIDMKVEAKIAPMIERQEKEKKEQAQAAALAQAEQAIMDRTDVALVAFADKIKPELAALVKDANGKPMFTDAALVLMDQADPVAYEEIQEAAAELRPITAELLALDTVPGYELQPQANKFHRQIQGYRRYAERELAGTEFSDGRKFMAQDEMDRRAAEITNGVGSKEERQQKLTDLHSTYRSLDNVDMVEIISDQIAQRCKAKIDKRDAVARRKYGQNPPNQPQTAPEGKIIAPQPAPNTPTPTFVPAPPTNGKPRPPSLGGGAEVSTNRSGAPDTAKTWAQTVNESAFK